MKNGNEADGGKDGYGDSPGFFLLHEYRFGLGYETAVNEMDEQSTSNTDDNATEDVTGIMNAEVNSAIASEDRPKDNG